MKFTNQPIPFLLISVWILSCNQNIKWNTKIDGSGTFSSPRAIDLNQDGVKDIVLGAGGRREWESSENGVIAFNGKEGTVMWKKDCRNQIIGSPIFRDITEDEIPDIFIGGRSAQFMSLDGKTGELIWEYHTTTLNVKYETDTTILNFFNPQFISDQDQDGIDDIIVSYGGYVEAKPNELNRPIGYLMVFSAKTGKLISKAPMPDGKETYMSPVVMTQNNLEHIIFGTGGETISGNLYITEVIDILDGLINEYDTLIEGLSKGFIAPPIIVDLNEDDVDDLVINAFEGKTYAIDGKKRQIIWSVYVGEQYETHGQPAPGNFIGDEFLDFVVNYGKGEWPNVTGAIQIVIDGSNGDFSVVDSLGYLQYASPIPVKRDHQKMDLILLPVNDKLPTNFAPETGYPSFSYQSMLYLLDLSSDERGVLITNPGVNTGSTALVEDLNRDGTIELIYVYNTNPYNPFVHNGFRIECQTYRSYSSIWNQYMGRAGKSHFQ